VKSWSNRTRALTLAVLATLALPACVGGGRTAVIPTALNCAGLIPARLRQPVEPAPLPGDNSVGAWVSFGDAQTGRLELSEDRRATVLQIVDGCSREQTKVTEGLKRRPWWRFD
jgi:hypothetical protein